ncbi:MAG TPA: hypothetical protein VLJ86_26675 [Ramlibacter sp.]|nr:hypothetical protein [Ramlibacter sp.]
MRTTSQKPVENLVLHEAVRLADDVRRFKVVSIDHDAYSSDHYRITVQSEDGLRCVLNLDGDDMITVWVKEPARTQRSTPVAASEMPVRRTNWALLG